MAYNIKEIWSLDLAHVDKIAKENKDVKKLVGCAGFFLTFSTCRTLEIKNTRTAGAFKEMIKNK